MQYPYTFVHPTNPKQIKKYIYIKQNKNNDNNNDNNPWIILILRKISRKKKTKTSTEIYTAIRIYKIDKFYVEWQKNFYLAAMQIFWNWILTINLTNLISVIKCPLQ